MFIRLEENFELETETCVLYMHLITPVGLRKQAVSLWRRKSFMKTFLAWRQCIGANSLCDLGIEVRVESEADKNCFCFTVGYTHGNCYPKYFTCHKFS